MMFWNQKFMDVFLGEWNGILLFFPAGPNVEAASRGYSWCLLKQQLESDCTQEISALVKSSLADESKRLPLLFIPLQLAKLSFYLWLTIFLVILAVQINTVFNKPVPDIPFIAATCVWRLRVVQKLPWGAKLWGLTSLRSLGLWFPHRIALPSDISQCSTVSESLTKQVFQPRAKMWYSKESSEEYEVSDALSWYMSWHYFGKFIQDPPIPWHLSFSFKAVAAYLQIAGFRRYARDRRFLEQQLRSFSVQEAKCSDAQDRHTIEATILSWFETSDLEVGSNVQNVFKDFFEDFQLVEAA